MTRLMLCGALLLLSYTPHVQACSYSKLMRSFQKALTAFNANPTPANLARVCRKIDRIQNKFTNTAPTLTPTLPQGVSCGGGTMTGSGRGGGPGGIFVGIGQGAVTHGWVRNFEMVEKTYDYEIRPDPANPPGFTLFPLTGSIAVPAQSSASVAVDVDVAATVPSGTLAFFDIIWTDRDAALPLPDDTTRFQIFADPELTILPADPFLIAQPGVMLPVQFEITNHTNGPVSRTFDFIHIGDPASVIEMNNGTPFDAVNLFPDDKSISSVDVTIPALATQMVLKETLRLGEICDPQMINCCGLSFGAGTCCANIFNDDLMPRSITPLFNDLVGQPQAPGQLGFQVDRFIVQIPIDPLMSIPEMLDQLTQQTLNFTQNQDGFNFFPVVDGDSFMLMAPLPLPIDPFVTDPGLQWQPSFPPLEPLLPSMPQGLELMTQAIEVVNGWRPMMLPPPP